MAKLIGVFCDLGVTVSNSNRPIVLIVLQRLYLFVHKKKETKMAVKAIDFVNHTSWLSSRVLCPWEESALKIKRFETYFNVSWDFLRDAYDIENNLNRSLKGWLLLETSREVRFTIFDQPQRAISSFWIALLLSMVFVQPYNWMYPQMIFCARLGDES